MRFVRSIVGAVAMPWQLIISQIVIWATPKILDGLLEAYKEIQREDNTMPDVDVDQLAANKDKAIQKVKVNAKSRGGGKIFR